MRGSACNVKKHVRGDEVTHFDKIETLDPNNFLKNNQNVLKFLVVAYNNVINQ